MGRHATGWVQLTEQRAKLLPEFGTAYKFAKVIGVSTTCIRQWINQGMPAYPQLDGSYILLREQVLSWLWATERYTGPTDF